MIDVMHHISRRSTFQYIYPQLKHFSETIFTAFMCYTSLNEQSMENLERHS